MANVAYSSIYDYIRTPLGDFDSTNYDYSDIMLIAAITWILLFDSISGYAKVSGSDEITPDITLDNNKTKELALKAAKLLLQPTESFSYRQAVLSIDRKGDSTKEDLLASIDKQLTELAAGGHKPIQSDGAIDQYLTIADRVEDILDEHL